jgi:sterol desaturase/sphingolipid hydroxylase (fatty acid hydroxylase superfamily)
MEVFMLGFTLGLIGSLIYGSFLEWFIHKVVMHTTRISQLAFDRHAIEHHLTRRSLKTFYIPQEEKAAYHLGESSVIPILWLLHVPVYYVVWKYAGAPAGVASALGGLLYLLGYEFIHFFIHAPKGHWFQRTRLFRFYCEYHRVHHHKARVNYNIVIPLADRVLRTQSFEELNVEPSRPEYMAPDRGPRSPWSKAPSEPSTTQS